MEPIERKIRIAAPVEHVWRVFSDIDRLPERIDHVVSVERIGGPEFDVGTTWRHVARAPRGAETGARQVQTAATVEVIGCARGEFYVLAIETPLGRAVHAYEFTPIAEATTELRAVVQLQPTGLWSRIVVGLLGRFLARALDTGLERLMVELKRATERLHEQNRN